MKKTQELIIKDMLATEAQCSNLRCAFYDRNLAEWDLPIEKYGFGCSNIDEVLTHIQHDTMFDYSPPRFQII